MQALLAFLVNAGPLISMLVNLVETLHPQPKSGPQKLDKVLMTVETLANDVPGIAADADKIRQFAVPIIESHVAAMKKVQQIWQQNDGGPG